MTSDAKVGLLLGLVFIFIIAFIINGLPSFRKDANNNELTTNMSSSRNNPPGIATKEREVINRIKRVEKQSLDEVRPSSLGEPDPRFVMALPKGVSAVKETVEIKPPAPASDAPTTAKKNEVNKSKSVKPPLPKVYVVNEGDSLAVIAQKFYGPDEGNKIINITRIFDANRRVLKSADEIYVGQEILVPPLPASYQSKMTDDIFSSTVFEKVESIGKRHLSRDGGGAKQGGWYVVRGDDSLWRIAAEQLGDGGRYSEITRLNAGILEDEDSLSVGMRLKMPAP